MSRMQRPRRAALAAATAVACLAGVLGAAAPAGAAPKLDPTQFRGVNWADPRDNYVDGPVVPTGLSTSDGYATVVTKTKKIVKEFAHDTGANTIRLPVNPYSVGTTWWKSYRGTIDAATKAGDKVVLSYWEGTKAKDGLIDDPAAWHRMWDTLTSTYLTNKRVYFEPMNEPFGYTDAAWIGVTTRWLDRYTADGVPRNRVFISGAGYNDHVDTVCAAAALNGTYVSQHFYGFWGVHDYAGWKADFLPRLGDQACSNRTILDEFGSPMTNGYDYTKPATTGDADADNFVPYLQAVSDVVRDRHMGAVYWPGLRGGDTYSLETLRGTGTKLNLVVNSPTGLKQLQWAWGTTATRPHPAY